jgi:hypothetical protein
MRVVRGPDREYMRILAEIKRFEGAGYNWVGVSGFAETEKYYWENMQLLGTILADKRHPSSLAVFSRVMLTQSSHSN